MSKRGWTGYQLAEQTGLNDSTIYNIFSKKPNPTLKTLEIIAEAFEISLSQLFKNEDKNDKETVVLMHYFSLSKESREIIDLLFEKLH